MHKHRSEFLEVLMRYFRLSLGRVNVNFSVLLEINLEKVSSDWDGTALVKISALVTRKKIAEH